MKEEWCIPPQANAEFVWHDSVHQREPITLDRVGEDGPVAIGSEFESMGGLVVDDVLSLCHGSSSGPPAIRAT